MTTWLAYQHINQQKVTLLNRPNAYISILKRLQYQAFKLFLLCVGFYWFYSIVTFAWKMPLFHSILINFFRDKQSSRLRWILQSGAKINQISVQFSDWFKLTNSVPLLSKLKTDYLPLVRSARPTDAMSILGVQSLGPVEVACSPARPRKRMRPSLKV